MSSRIISFALLLTAASAAPLPAAPVREGALVAEIVPAKTSIAPGETIDLALRIAHDESWHTYWKSPGIVGLATQLDWKLPDGFVAGEILWPQPESVKMGPYTAYGYEGETFLVVPFTAPANAKPGTKIKLQTRASWMCCAKTCHPAFVDLKLDLPISTKTGEATKWQKHIDAARTTFPKTNDIWLGSAHRVGETIVLQLKPKKAKSASPPKEPYFFSHDGLIHSDAAQIVTRGDDGSLTLKLTTSEFGPKKPTHLRGILYTKTGKPDGSGASPVELEIPLTLGR
jgi:DsbC/DsbD-like thiol-disulfide interchange protein